MDNHKTEVRSRFIGYNYRSDPVALRVILKQEHVHWRNYQTRYEVQQDILNYISMFYNPYRLHSTLGYVSPGNHEKQLTEMKEAA